MKIGTVRALVLRPGNTVEEVTLRSLPDYKEALDGGWLEPIHLKQGVMYVDEEFLLKNYTRQDINRIATGLVKMIGFTILDSWILGPAIVVGPTDPDGNDTDVTADVEFLVRKIQLSVQAKEN